MAERPLSLAEKVKLLSGDGPWHTHAVGGLPPAEVSDGPHGLRTETGVDMVWVPSTCFPTGSALASSWDPGLARRVGRAIGEEARAMGVQCLLGPGVNLKRDPRCGRNFEYLSEDPTLAAVLGSAWIEGLQSAGVAACLKHFAANNQETERTEISVEADEGALRELYLEAFRRIVRDAGPWSMMCSYNRIRGVRASQSHWLLTEVLREEWGYDGVMMSDWDAVHDPVAAVRAGLDLEMPGTDGRSEAALLAAVEAGTLSEAEIDRGAARVARFVARVLPDGKRAASAVRDPGIVPGTPLSETQLADLGAARHHQLAREAATAAAVLLRNEARTLPLATSGSERIAVVGGYAVTPRIQGGGSAGVQPTGVDSPVDAIIALAGAERVVWAQGYPVGETDYYQEAEPVGQDPRQLRAAALEVARGADIVVAFVGLPLVDEREAFDRDHLTLPPEQTELLVALADLGKPLVVVLAAGSAVVLEPAWQAACGAILLTHLGGQAVGTATADLLFGLACPSGKLAETWPVRLSDTPAGDAFPDHGVARYPEGLLIGHRWYDQRRLPVAYPFGHGLSYAEFGYRDLVVTEGVDDVTMTVTVTNTSGVAGREVVQFYATPPVAAERPRVLAGFASVSLGAGESAVAQVRVPRRDLAAWFGPRDWRQSAGDWVVEAATSSRNSLLSGLVTLTHAGFEV